MNLLAEQQWTGRIFTGTWHPADGGVSSVVEPATGKELGTVGLASTTDMARAVAGAQQAQRAWAAASFGDRAAVLRRAAELWARHSEEIRAWLIREGGSTRSKALYEVRSGESECLEAAALPSHPVGDVLATDHALLSMSRRVPVGVVGVIAPFNGPIKLAIRSVAPALALGNAVVLKPDPRTAVCGGVSIARVFEEAGLPPGVLHVLAGGADAGAALVADPAVSAVSFTGSTSAGRSVGEAAAHHLTRAHLELGGNNALIVLGDADIDLAVNAAAHGTFFNAGQACMASGRHLVHESVYDEYVHKLAARASELTVGDPYTRDVALGPIIDARQRDKIHDLVTKSVDAGARLLAGGPTTGSSTVPPCWPMPARGYPPTTTRSSARSPRSLGSPPSTKRRNSPPTASTASRWASSPQTWPPGWNSWSGSPLVLRTSTTRRSTTTPTPPSAECVTPAAKHGSAARPRTSRPTPTSGG
jgi:benzaldehyde dehydrogenase (NAD)